MRLHSALARLARFAIADGLGGTFVALAAAHHNLWGLVEPAGSGDRLRRWRAGERHPILFCHGYMGDPSNFALLRRRLHLAGFRSQAAIWHRPFWRSCSEYARALEARVREVARRTGAPAVDLVAHSMGGIAARRLFLDPEVPVRRLVTLGSPHRGAIHAIVGPGACARDLCPGSPFLRSLEGDFESLPPGTITSICADLDLFAPARTARVPFQRNVPVSGIGHSGLLVDARVARAVAETLRLDARSLAAQAEPDEPRRAAGAPIRAAAAEPASVAY